ncbi:MAG TPA: hypothetical protein VMW62_11270 [Chloroflexota bacterium]|nr:hypothetical protein [Chloroflexota bacterium]
MAEKSKQPERVGGMTGNKVDNVKNIERDAAGNVVAEPGDLRYVRDEVAPADEAAREQGQVYEYGRKAAVSFGAPREPVAMARSQIPRSTLGMTDKGGLPTPARPSESRR